MKISVIDACVLTGFQFTGQDCPTEMILGFATRYACLEDLDKWAASRLQVACK